MTNLDHSRWLRNVSGGPMRKTGLSTCDLSDRRPIMDMNGLGSLTLAIFIGLFSGLASHQALAIRAADMNGSDQHMVSGVPVDAKLVYNFNEIYCPGPVANFPGLGCSAEVSGATPYNNSSASGVPLSLLPNKDGNAPNAPADLAFNVSSKFRYVIVNYKENGIESGADTVDQGYQKAQNHRSLLKSSGSPYNAALNDAQCSNELTVQMWVKPLFPFHGQDTNANNQNQGAMIVGISNSTLDTVSEPDWAIYQVGDSGAEQVRFRVRTQGGAGVNIDSPPGVFSSVREIRDTDYSQSPPAKVAVGSHPELWDGFELSGKAYESVDPSQFTEIIATIRQDPVDMQKRATVYVNRIPSASIPVSFTPSMSTSSSLVIGNDLVKLTQKADGTNILDNQKNWSGLIKHVAIYCNGVEKTEVLGTVAIPGVQTMMAAIEANPDAPISNERKFAQRLAQRLTGTLFPIDHPDLTTMENLIKAGKMVEAAQVMTGDKASGTTGNPGFLNVIVKQMALVMSNREETARVPLNDMAAMFIGVTRDETSAKELLTGDFYYAADPNIAKVRNNFVNDILLSNNHFRDLDNGDWDIGKALMRIDSASTSPIYPKGQQILENPISKTIKPSPDPAGVITSRAWMGAHAIAGTNRRLVEYSLREFLCVPLSEAADTSVSDARIGRDVDRKPGGDESKFQTSCKGCHNIQDGMRGAFAFWDYRTSQAEDGRDYEFVRNTMIGNQYHAADGTGTDQGCITDNSGPVLPGIDKVIYKMNHNCKNFNVLANAVTDNSFVNNAQGFKNKVLFGWRGDNKNGGNGTQQFGQMIADSKRFSQCMAKRVYESVCLPAIPYDFNEVRDKIFSYGDAFENNNYNLKKLFQMIAVDPICIKMR